MMPGASLANGLVAALPRGGPIGLGDLAVRKATELRRVGYGQRNEPIRASLKFLCDLGAHPEAAEMRKHDTHAAHPWPVSHRVRRGPQAALRVAQQFEPQPAR